MCAVGSQLAVLTDVHANLPALQAVMAEVDALGIREVVHCGDAIDFGPSPAEVLDVLQAARVRCVTGNHDELLHHSVPADFPAELKEHVAWTRNRVSPHQRRQVAAWPKVIELDLSGVGAAAVHYAWQGQAVAHPPPQDTPEALDLVFSAQSTPVGSWLFHGHSHRRTDVVGRCRYLSPGPAGLNQSAAGVAPYFVVTCRPGGITVEHREARYDPTGLLRDLRRVAAGDYVLREFHPCLL